MPQQPFIFILRDDHFVMLGRTLFPGGCDTGDAKITKAYKLPSCVNLEYSVIGPIFIATRKYVIHAVGPQYYGSSDVKTKEEQLASCYRTSLQLAVQNSLKHIVRSPVGERDVDKSLIWSRLFLQYRQVFMGTLSKMQPMSPLPRPDASWIQRRVQIRYLINNKKIKCFAHFE